MTSDINLTLGVFILQNSDCVKEEEAKLRLCNLMKLGTVVYAER